MPNTVAAPIVIPLRPLQPGKPKHIIDTRTRIEIKSGIFFIRSDFHILYQFLPELLLFDINICFAFRLLLSICMRKLTPSLRLMLVPKGTNERIK